MKVIKKKKKEDISFSKYKSIFLNIMAQPPTASNLDKTFLSNVLLVLWQRSGNITIYIIETTMKLFTGMKMTEITVCPVNNQLFLKTT